MFQKFRDIPYYTQKLLRESLAWAYFPSPSWPRTLLKAPLRAAARLDRRSASQPCLYRVSGRSSVDSRPFQVAFLGDWQIDAEPCLTRYEGIFFQPGSAVRQAPVSVDSGGLRQQAEALSGEVDLLAVASTRPWQPPVGSWISLPAGCRVVFHFDPPALRDSLRALLDGLLSVLPTDVSISHRVRDFLFLYRNLYTPALQNNPSGYGELLSEPAALDLFHQHPSLLFLQDDHQQILAGALCFPWHGMLHSLFSGALEGRSDWLDALVYAGLRFALNRGYAGYVSGLCAPFSADRGFTRAQTLGGDLLPDPWHPERILLWAPPGSSAGLDWLQANPLPPHIAQAGGQGSLRAPLSAPPPPAPVDVPTSAPAVPVAPAVPAASAAPAAPAASAAPSFRFETFGKPPAEAQKCISQGLIQHAIGALGPELGNFYYPLCITIRDDQNRLVGGLIGKFTWNFLHIDSLWVSGEHRGHNLGSRLMRMAEESARAEGIRCITVETTSFEAIGFYPKLGYEVIAEIKDVPPGHSFYYLKKML